MIDTVNDGKGGGLGLRYAKMNLDCLGEAESLRNFTTITSPFYPDLFDHHDDIHERWVEDPSEAGEEVQG